MIDVIAWLALIPVFVGSELVIRQKWPGWVLWLVANAIWFALNLHWGLWPQALVYVGHSINTVRGIRHWRRLARSPVAGKESS